MTFLIGLLKIIIAIGLLALAFWPNGLGVYIVNHFNDMPIGYTVIISIWAAAVSLNLPLSRAMFTKISTICLAAIFAAVMVKLYQAGKFDVANSNQWIITSIFFVGITIGWWTNAAVIWRWYRHITAVDDADTGDGDFA